MGRSGEPLTQEELEEQRTQHMIEYAKREEQARIDRENWPSAKKVFDKAKAESAWVYDPKDKHWYTPEEFLEKYKHITGGAHYFNEVKVLSPYEGLEAGLTKVSNLQARVVDFSKRIHEYFKKKI